MIEDGKRPYIPRVLRNQPCYGLAKGNITLGIDLAIGNVVAVSI